MKRVFLIAFAVLTTLTAFAEKSIDQQKTGYDNANYRGDGVFSKCIDGVSYLFISGYSSLTVQRDKNDKPVTCGE